MSIHFILVLMLAVVSSKVYSYELTFPPLEKPVHRKATFTSADYSNQALVDIEKTKKITDKENQNSCRACRIIIYYPYMPYSPWQYNFKARNNNFMSAPFMSAPFMSAPFMSEPFISEPEFRAPRYFPR